jgi:hypothetical protein
MLNVSAFRAAMVASIQSGASTGVEFKLKCKRQFLPTLDRLSGPTCLFSNAHRLGEFSISYPYLQGSLRNVKLCNYVLLVDYLHIHLSSVKKAYSVSRYIYLATNICRAVVRTGSRLRAQLYRKKSAAGQINCANLWLASPRIKSARASLPIACFC